MTFLFLIASASYAQEKTATPSAETNKEAVEKIKKIAENVIEEGVKNKAISGKIIEIGTEEIVIEDLNNKKITVSLFITDYYQVMGSKFSEIKKDSLKKGDYIFVTGPLVGDTVTANAVYKDTSYFFISGKVATVNKSDYSVDIITVDKRRVIVDIESSTKQNLLNIKTKKTDKIGFSKLKEGDSLHVVIKGFRLMSSDERYQASRILVLPNEYFLQ
jgi:hypothetical protein